MRLLSTKNHTAIVHATIYASIVGRSVTSALTVSTTQTTTTTTATRTAGTTTTRCGKQHHLFNTPSALYGSGDFPVFRHHHRGTNDDGVFLPHGRSTMTSSTRKKTLSRRRILSTNRLFSSSDGRIDEGIPPYPMSSSSSSSSLSSSLFRLYYNDVYEVQLPPKHRFPMKKYQLVRKRIQQNLLEMEGDEDIIIPEKSMSSSSSSFLLSSLVDSTHNEEEKIEKKEKSSTYGTYNTVPFYDLVLYTIEEEDGIARRTCMEQRQQHRHHGDFVCICCVLDDEGYYIKSKSRCLCSNIFHCAPHISFLCGSIDHHIPCHLKTNDDDDDDDGGNRQ
jgi:hypothetical protein